MSSSIASGDANILIKKLFFDKESKSFVLFSTEKKEPKKAASFCQKEAKTTPFRIRHSV
ncbi:hypothetical protein [Brachyspira sp.]|uniref:hypothetical protein n=1 Tax=Brachyspira sp. TaxID=1977261 RepID=UPI003D7D835E